MLDNSDANVGHNYLQEIFGDIIASSTEDESTIKIGTIKAIKVLSDNAINNRMSVYDLFDHMNQTSEIYEFLYDEDGDLHPAIVTDDIMCAGNNVLILDRIEIEPQYRGHSIGKQAIKNVFDNFVHGCGLMALKAFPLDFESSDENDIAQDKDQVGYNKRFQVAQKKLIKYYKSMGLSNPRKDFKEFFFISPVYTNKKW